MRIGVPALFRRQAHATRCRDLTSNIMFIVQFIIAALCSHAVLADTDDVSTVNKTEESNLVHEFEVPDSFLLNIARMRNKLTPSQFARARQNVAQNGTTTNTSSSSSSSDRRCTCHMGVCKCCTGYLMDLLRQKACMKVTYHPGDFAFDVAMSLNNRILYENSMSGKNPRPICISPPRISNLKVCAKFYNVFFPGRNFHFCLAMYGQWRSFELFNFRFDCLRMGANGMAMVGPDEGGGLPVPNPQGGVDAVIDSGDEDIDDYDENVVRSLLGDLFDDDDEDDDDDDDRR